MGLDPCELDADMLGIDRPPMAAAIDEDVARLDRTAAPDAVGVV